MIVRINHKSSVELAGVVLAAGELAYAHNVNHLKIGDGVTPWNQLPILNRAKKLAWVQNNNLRVAYPDVGIMRYLIKERRGVDGEIAYGVQVVARINNNQWISEYRGETTGAPIVNEWAFNVEASFSPATPSALPYQNNDGSYLKYKIYDLPLSIHSGLN